LRKPGKNTYQKALPPSLFAEHAAPSTLHAVCQSALVLQELSVSA
jgi:hypothetical protein